MSTAIKPQTVQPDPNVVDVNSHGEKALQALSLLYNSCHRVNPDSPICSAVQDLMSATAEVLRYVEQVGPDLEEGTPDDNPEAAPMEEPMMGRDPGPMGPGAMNEAGRGFDQALMAASQPAPPPY